MSYNERDIRDNLEKTGYVYESAYENKHIHFSLFIDYAHRTMLLLVIPREDTSSTLIFRWQTNPRGVMAYLMSHTPALITPDWCNYIGSMSEMFNVAFPDEGTLMPEVVLRHFHRMMLDFSVQEVTAAE